MLTFDVNIFVLSHFEVRMMYTLTCYKRKVLCFRESDESSTGESRELRLHSWREEQETTEGKQKQGGRRAHHNDTASGGVSKSILLCQPTA